MYKRVIEKLNKTDLDAYLIQGEHNRNYLCNKGNYCLPGTLLVTKNEVYLATLSRNFEYFEELYSEYNVIKGGIADIVEICKTLKIKRLGYESNITSKMAYDNLKNAFNMLELVDEANFIESLRWIKTENEISLIKEATIISDKAYIEFLNHIKTGQSEAQARNIFNDIMMKFGADGFSFETLLSSGEQCFLPHSAPTNKIIEKGDFILMDFGIKLNGYCSDTSRTIVMGKADERQKEVYELVLKAQCKAVENIHAGMSAKQADLIAKDIINTKMPNFCYDYSLGHGIGLEVHELPFMNQNSDVILQENMVVSVEPGVYVKGWGGVRIEDVIAIKNNKSLNLTTAPKELIEI